jgi:hypothetical protein
VDWVSIAFRNAVSPSAATQILKISEIVT